MKIPTLLKLAALLGVAPKSQDPSIEMPEKGSRPSRGPAWYRAQKGIPDQWVLSEDQPSRQRANVEAVRMGWLKSDRRSRRAKARQAVRLGAV